MRILNTRTVTRKPSWILQGAALVVLCVLAITVAAPKAGAASAGFTVRASVAPGGTQGNAASALGDISSDGRFVVFRSGASNLVAGDTNGQPDIFVSDLASGTVTRASVTNVGSQASGASVSAAISADGRYVAFVSEAGNLVPGDTNGDTDVFVRDTIAGTTERISVAADGAQGDGASLSVAMSDDGRFVAFESASSNLVPGDTNDATDIFVRDTLLDVTSRVTGDGAQASDLSISGDGRYVAFVSGSADLVAGDTNGTTDVFVSDVVSGTIERVSVTDSEGQANGGSLEPSLSFDGRRVAFGSYASNLVVGDTNSSNTYEDADIFVRDLDEATTRRASVASDGSQANAGSSRPCISGDGRHVAFISSAWNLLPGDANGFNDVFVHDTESGDTRRASTAVGGAQADNHSYIAALSADGRLVAFTSLASNLVAGDTNRVVDVFVNDSLVGGASTVARVAGATRYDVAAGLARRGWDPLGNKSWANVQHVIVANGEAGKEADPLSAAGLAGVYDAPVLLIQATKVPTATKTVLQEIAARNPGVKVHLIGGPASLPDARWNDIKALSGVSATKDRIAGADRYSTSAAIASRIVLVAPSVGKTVKGAILIAGDDPSAFYDALAASPIAFARTMPLLSVKAGSVPPSVAAVLNGALKGKPRYAASSATYISAGALAGATRLTNSANRYTAAAEIGNRARTNSWVTATHTGLAAKLPDALTGGAYLGKEGGVLLFTDSTSAIQSASRAFIVANKSQITNGWVIGGTASVPLAQETSFRNLLK